MNRARLVQFVRLLQHYDMDTLCWLNTDLDLCFNASDLCARSLADTGVLEAMDYTPLRETLEQLEQLDPLFPSLYGLGVFFSRKTGCQICDATLKSWEKHWPGNKEKLHALWTLCRMV